MSYNQKGINYQTNKCRREKSEKEEMKFLGRNVNYVNAIDSVIQRSIKNF